jgi:hypothetical protein
MPKISEWGAISIFINTRGEHNSPHFHVMSAEWEASIRISDFGVMAGKLPPRQLGEVVEWAALHQNELIEQWECEQRLPQESQCWSVSKQHI